MSEPGQSPRQFSNAFKERMVLRLEAGERIAAVAEEAGVKRKLLYQWRDAYRAMGVAGVNRKRGPKPGWKERRAAEGRAASAPAFSADAAASAAPLGRTEEGRGADRRTRAGDRPSAGGPAFFSRSLAALGRADPERRRTHLYAVIEKMIALESQGFSQDDANIQRLCGLGGVSRAGYYRHLGPHAPAGEDADLRDLIQRAALTNRHYGYRRIAQELRRQGLIVNAKRVLRLMREDNLLALRAKPFVPRTTTSDHGHPIRPNLVRRLKPTGLDQIWVADITYVRLAEDFVYLAVVIDAFSRKVVGWALANIWRPRSPCRRSTRPWPGEIPRPTASFIIPIAGCNTPAQTTSSGWRREASPSA